jgi:hypothetical protein
MRIILKNLRTGLYLDQSRRWSAKARAALDFETTAQAQQFCHKHRCFGTAILARFRDPRHDVALSRY